VVLNRKITFLAVALFLNATLVFSSIMVSGLTQYGENIGEQWLELLEDRQIIRLTSATLGLRYEVTGTYIIRNSGPEQQAMLGVLISQRYGPPPSHAGLEIQFFVDGIQFQYTVSSPEQSGVLVIGERLLETPQVSYTWVLIDVTFPQDSSVTIEVRHSNYSSFSSLEGSSITFNTSMAHIFTELVDWSGLPRFSVEVINDSKDSNGIEEFWVSDILFPSIHSPATSRMFMLPFLQSDSQRLANRFMEVFRTSENTFLIEFTQEYVERFDRGMTLYLRALGRCEMSPFVSVGSVPPYVSLGPLTGLGGGISRRELRPNELILLTNNQLRVMRNAFFAQHGFIFRSPDLANTFGNMHDYIPNPCFSEDMLTEIDRRNITTIQRLEALIQDWPYTQPSHNKRLTLTAYGRLGLHSARSLRSHASFQHIFCAQKCYAFFYRAQKTSST